MHKFYIFWRSLVKPFLGRFHRSIILAILILFLGVFPIICAILQTEHKISLKPEQEDCNDQLYPKYLEQWSTRIVQLIFQASPRAINERMDKIDKDINNNQLIKFLSNYQFLMLKYKFQSKFDIDQISFNEDRVIVFGKQRLYFAGNVQALTLNKCYFLYYRQFEDGRVFLTDIQENSIPLDNK